MKEKRSIVFLAFFGSLLACASTSKPIPFPKVAVDWRSLSLYERDYEGSRVSVCGTMEYEFESPPTEFEWLSASRDARFAAADGHEEWTSSPFCEEGIGADCASFSKVVRTRAASTGGRRDGLVGLRQYQHDERLSVRCAD